MSRQLIWLNLSGIKYSAKNLVKNIFGEELSDKIPPAVPDEIIKRIKNEYT